MLGFVVLTVHNADSHTSLQVAGQTIRRTAWSEPVPVVPGEVVVLVRDPNREPVERRVSVEPGQNAELTIDVAEAPKKRVAEEPMKSAAPPPSAHESQSSSLMPYVWIAGGVGVVGLAGFGILGSMASSTHSDLEKTCSSGPCPASEQSTIDRGKNQQLLANVALAVGVVGVAASVTLFVLDGSSDTTEAEAALVVGPSFVGIRGRL
jgi:hypothetical protein